MQCKDMENSNLFVVILPTTPSGNDCNSCQTQSSNGKGPITTKEQTSMTTGTKVSGSSQ